MVKEDGVVPTHFHLSHENIREQKYETIILIRMIWRAGVKILCDVPESLMGTWFVICKYIHQIQYLLNTNFGFQAETTFSKSEISSSNITHMSPMTSNHPLSWQKANENKITAGHRI